METVIIRRLGSKKAESVFTTVFLMVWAVLWLSTGFGAHALWKVWHGFVWGFFVSGVLAGFGTWFGIAVPLMRRMPAWSLAFEDHLLTIRDHRQNPVVLFDLSLPHRLSILRSSGSRQIYVKLEQPGTGSYADGDRGNVKQLKLLGVPSPKKNVGDDMGAVACHPDVTELTPRLGSTVTLADAPFQVDAGAPDAFRRFSSFLAFLKAHEESRTIRPFLSLPWGRLTILDDGFSLLSPGSDSPVDYLEGCLVYYMARPERHGPGRLHARVFVALVLEENEAPPLCFRVDASEPFLRGLPSGWDLDPSVNQKAVPLDVSTPDAALAANALRGYLVKNAPSHPILKVLQELVGEASAGSR